MRDVKLLQSGPDCEGNMPSLCIEKDLAPQFIGLCGLACSEIGSFEPAGVVLAFGFRIVAGRCLRRGGERGLRTLIAGAEFFSELLDDFVLIHHWKQVEQIFAGDCPPKNWR